MAITPWLHYADHPLAPTCRSRPGSNMPVGDRSGSQQCGVGEQADQEAGQARAIAGVLRGRTDRLRAVLAADEAGRALITKVEAVQTLHEGETGAVGPHADVLAGSSSRRKRPPFLAFTHKFL